LALEPQLEVLPPTPIERWWARGDCYEAVAPLKRAWWPNTDVQVIKAEQRPGFDLTSS
jgi:hypothetical protein